ncbi:uncharacterized protein LOC127794800 [Diospyros lotus]|uniref:uncharacterized protein LOC127794800 n=1 Tax=Diospyros lotus TaxID=55363 RepID=UPI00225B4C1D|nr:uncharacterized protein LOC127794800 [Diospyros lotus]
MISVELRKDGKLYESIYKSPVRDLDKFYKQAAKEIRWEETFGSTKSGNQKDEGGSTNQSKKLGNGNNDKRGQGRDPNDQVAKKVRNEQGGERPPHRGCYENYSIMSDTQDRIFAAEKNMEDFERPNPIKTPKKFRNKDKFCVYHNEAGHNTSECWALKDAIKELIRRGHLHDYVVWPRDQQSQQPVQLKPCQAPEQDQALAVRTIFTIHGGSHIAETSNRSHEHYVWEAGHLLLIEYSGQEGPSKKARSIPDDIIFTEKDNRDVHWPHNDALVVRAQIGNVEV